VVDAMLYIAQTGCQWRYLPETSGHGLGSGRSFAAGRATAPGRVPLTALHAAARQEDGRDRAARSAACPALPRVALAHGSVLPDLAVEREVWRIEASVGHLP
jgi:hypothetical protein